MKRLELVLLLRGQGEFPVNYDTVGICFGGRNPFASICGFIMNLEKIISETDLNATSIFFETEPNSEMD